MNLQTKYRIVLAFALFMFAVNIAAVTSIVVHLRQEKKAEAQAQQAGKYSSDRRYAAQGKINYRKMKLIEEKLQLTPEQSELFNEIYREHLHQAHVKFEQLRQYRNLINTELAKKKPNTKKIDQYAGEIGKLHKELTLNQVEMFLEMAEHCDKAQRDSLYQIYMQYQTPPRYRNKRKYRRN